MVSVTKRTLVNKTAAKSVRLSTAGVLAAAGVCGSVESPPLSIMLNPVVPSVFYIAVY